MTLAVLGSTGVHQSYGKTLSEQKMRSTICCAVKIPGTVVPVENPTGHLRWPTKMWVLGRWDRRYPRSKVGVGWEAAVAMVNPMGVIFEISLMVKAD